MSKKKKRISANFTCFNFNSLSLGLLRAKTKKMPGKEPSLYPFSKSNLLRLQKALNTNVLLKERHKSCEFFLKVNEDKRYC